MKKISTLLVVASLTTLAALTGAADCGTGGSAVECSTAADCANETENTACDTSIDPGVCVAPTCAETVDCEISDTSEASPIAAPGANGCEDGTVEIQGFVEGETYCAVSPDPSIPFTCDQAAEGGVDAAATDVDGNAVTVCVIAASSCTEGVCGASN
jgi:hypothetical protein